MGLLDNPPISGIIFFNLTVSENAAPITIYPLL